MSQTYEPIIPNEYVILKSRDIELRTLSVRKYQTRVSFERQYILESLEKSRLVFGTDFGVVKHTTLKTQNTLFGLYANSWKKNLVLLYPSNQLRSILVLNMSCKRP